jgi:FAD:protein FMN transferase
VILAPSGSTLPRVVVALEAMATRFVLSLWDEADPARLRAAGEAALAEIARSEERLSRFRPGSEIAWINAKAGRDPVRVSLPVFRLLEQCRELNQTTEGAFDPTVGPLMRVYGFRDKAGPRETRAIEAARDLVGMERVELRLSDRTVRLPVSGMELDLGAIGKGAAVDAAVAVLRESEIGTALLDGGGSSVHAIGVAPDGAGWRIGWRVPGEPDPRVIELNTARPALAVSAPHGRTATSSRWGHVLDPARGKPIEVGWSALASGPSSTVCDALATALLVLGPTRARRALDRLPDYVGLVAGPTAGPPAPLW